MSLSPNSRNTSPLFKYSRRSSDDDLYKVETCSQTFSFNTKKWVFVKSYLYLNLEPSAKISGVVGVTCTSLKKA